MNGRYSTMEDAADRLTEAFIAAVDAYYREHPRGAELPSRSYIARFIKEFVEREALEIRVKELRSKLNDPVALYERELLTALGDKIRSCNKKIGIHKE
jgi:hypothetical protein